MQQIKTAVHNCNPDTSSVGFWMFLPKRGQSGLVRRKVRTIVSQRPGHLREGDGELRYRGGLPLGWLDEGVLVIRIHGSCGRIRDSGQIERIQDLCLRQYY